MEVNNLPDDVLVEIFSYIPVRDLVFSVQNVCPRWKEVANYNALWTSKTYRPLFEKATHDIVSFLKTARKLQILDLGFQQVNSEILHTFVNYCPHLKNVEFNVYQKLSASFLEEFVEKCPNVERLKIPSATISDITSMTNIGRLSKLKYLHVVGYDCSVAAQLKPIADGCPALQHLDLTDKIHAHDDLAYFLEKKKDQLVSLNLLWSGIDKKCCVPLLLICNVLRSVLLNSFIDASVSDYDDTYIEPDFQSLRKLNTVTSVTFTDFGQAEIDDLAGVFNKNGMSQLLKLSIVNYDDYEDRLLKVIVENCPQLKLLRLENLSLADEGVEYICALHELENLSLSNSDITEESLKHIVTFEKLKYLNLSLCKKVKDWSSIEVMACSDLRVMNLDGCDLKGFCFQWISTYLKHLYVLSIKWGKYDHDGLRKLKTDMPHLAVHESEVFVRILNFWTPHLCSTDWSI